MSPILKSLTLLALAAGTVSTAAQATNPTAPLRDGKPTVAINTADLDLSKPADARRLRRRIADGLEAVCGSYAGAQNQEDAAITACRRQALADLPAPVLAVMTHKATRQA